jgi:hypothetical protein
MAAPSGPPGAPMDGGKKGRKPGLLDQLKRKPGLALGGVAVAGVVIFALYKRSQGAAAGDNTTTGDASAALPDSDVGTATPYSYDGSGGDSGLEAQLGSLQNQLQGITTSQPPGTLQSGLIPGTNDYLHEHPKGGGAPYVTINGRKVVAAPKRGKAKAPQPPPKRPAPKPPKPKPRPSRPLPRKPR